jgi:hypothetical protein
MITDGTMLHRLTATLTSTQSDSRSDRNTLPNPASVGFHESMGFEPIGVYENVGYKDGDWHDVMWWHKQLQTHLSSPPSPSTVREAQHREEWDDAITAGLSSIRLHE